VPSTPTSQATIATPVVPTPTQISQATPQSVANTSVIPSSERIVGFRHEQQTWNNCGPATLTTALSYFGWTRDQEYAKNILRPNREDKNVSPDELVNFVNTQTQIKAIARMGGNLQILKTLIANRFPVIVERGIMFEAYDWVGHYQLLVAYDDGQGQFYAYDSFLGTGAAEQGISAPYQQLDEDWRAFNRTFLVVYNPADEGLLKTLLGDLFDPLKAAEIAFNTAQAETRKNTQDAFAWFNMGSSLVALNDFQRAASAFDQARRYILPWRLTWYEYGPFIAYFNVGRFDDVLSLADINLTNAQELEETYYWRGKVYEAQGDIAKASSEFQRALGYNPNYQAARDALDALS
jgi:tetratricopeptide (TPR) repeat protein